MVAPLQYTELVVPFTGGLDTKTDSKTVVPTKLLRLQDMEFKEGGSLVKRPGSTAIPALDAYGLPYRGSPKALGPFGDNLALLTSTSMYSYAERADRASWKGNYYPVTPRDKGSVALSEEAKNGEVVTVGNLTVKVWQGVGSTVKAVISDALSGAVHFSNLYAGTSASDAGGTTNTTADAPLVAANAVSPRTFAIGNVAFVTWADTSTNAVMLLRILPWDVASSVAATPYALASDLASNRLYAVVEVSDTQAAIVYNSDNSVAAGVRLALVSTSGVASGHVVHSTTNATAGVAIAYSAGSSMLFVASQDDDSSDANSRVATYDLDLVQVDAAVVTLDTSDPSGVALAPQTDDVTGDYGCVLFHSIEAAEKSDYQTQVVSLDSTLVTLSERTVRHSFIASGGFSDGSTGYALLAHESQSGLQNAYYLFTGYLDMAGRLLALQGAPEAAFTGNLPQPRGATAEVLLAYQNPLEKRAESDTPYQHLSLKHFEFDFTSKPITAEMGGALYSTGCQLWYFDGSVPVESGFHMFPDMLTTSLSPDTGGDMGEGAYNYRVYYVWLCPLTGQKMRSAAIVRSVDVAATGQVQLTIPTLSFTQKQGRLGAGKVWIEVYRTEVDEATFYHKVTSSNPADTGDNGWVDNDLTDDYVLFVDVMSDEDLILNEIDYVTQGELRHYSPPAPGFIRAIGNRLFLVGGAIPNNTVVYSMEYFDGEPVDFAFETVFTDVPEEGGALKGVGYRNETPVFFKERAIFALVGQGVNATGTEGGYQAQTISTEVGVSAPATIVEAPHALMWHTPKGIYGMGDNLRPEYVGAPVERYNALTFVAARVVPDTNIVLFTSSDGLAVYYDHFYNQWGTYTNHQAKDLAVHRNARLVTLKTDDRMFVRNTATFTDGGTVYAWKFRTAPIRPFFWSPASSVQGMFKMLKYILLGDYVSPHLLKVSLYYNRELTAYETFNWDPHTVIDTTLWGESGIIWGQPGMIWGGSRNPNEYQLEKAPKRTKAQTISFEFEEIPGENPGASAELTELLLTMAPFPSGHARIAATRKV